MTTTKQPSESPFDLSRLWPLALVAVGLVWLLAAAGVISGASMAILLSYWPLLLIAVGLDIVVGRTTAYRAPFTILAVGILLVLMLLGPPLGLARGAKVVTETFGEPLGNAASARITLDLASAPTTVFAVRAGSDLVQAELTHVGTIDFSVRGDREKVVQLSRRGPAGFFPFGLGPFQRLRWDIGLSPAVPIDLAIDVGSGPAELRLAGLELSALVLGGGSGSMDVELPAASTRYGAELRGGSGPVRLTVADEAALDLDMDVGSGPFTAVLGRDLDMRLTLSGGSGPSTIQLPRGAAVRLEVRDDGSGPLNAGGGLQRVSGEGDEGVWQTPGFEGAARRIEITVRDAGSGPISVR